MPLSGLRRALLGCFWPSRVRKTARHDGVDAEAQWDDYDCATSLLLANTTREMVYIYDDPSLREPLSPEDEIFPFCGPAAIRPEVIERIERADQPGNTAARPLVDVAQVKTENEKRQDLVEEYKSKCSTFRPFAPKPLPRKQFSKIEAAIIAAPPIPSAAVCAKCEKRTSGSSGTKPIVPPKPKRSEQKAHNNPEAYPLVQWKKSDSAVEIVHLGHDESQRRRSSK
ncbi:hypothetical protein M3Y99_00862200 [Aphelenchoides fujianensis]|nr:hypothetical protein M3Y99_00862200 [Aphelenchoides fujianensis]